MDLSQFRRPAALLLLAFAALGIPLAATDSGCAFQVKDPITNTWRDATPIEMTGFANETGAIVRTTVADTPLAPALPWVEMALRLGALFAAWRVVPASASVVTTNKAVPSPQPKEGSV
jgi:hypothetical protein